MPQTMADPFKSIPMSPNLGRALDRAQEFAREQSHRALLLEHVLLALTEDPEASAVLRACNVDVVRLSTDVSGYLGRLPEDMRGDLGTEPPADHELLRVLEAARQAAHQSRRRQIDGSIVLAAIVGDGKSPAAGLLKAHGMTFDEAIRALQKASAQARSKQFASPPGPAASEPPAKAEKPAAATPPPPAAEPALPAAQPPAPGQSVDEILAAARARIQQRATPPAKPEPRPEPKPAAKAPPADEPVNLPLMSLSSFKATPAPPLPDMPPRLDGQDDGPADAPVKADGAAPPPPPAAPRLPPPQELPLPPRSLQQAIEGAQPPPHPPPRAGPDGPSRPRLPGLAARAQRPEPAEPAPPRRPPAANGKLPHPRRTAAEAPRAPARSGTAPRSGQRAAAGPLVEAIPRRMRVGAPSLAQVRIGRDKIDGLMQLLMAGRAQHRPDAVIARSLTVRLRAPDGSFWIEAESPETQWIEATSGQRPDEPVSWRWTVVPQRRGRRRLQLLVAARTIGQDGIASETAPPDRVIEVAVAGHPARRVLRLIAWLAALGVGAALGRYGLELWENGPALLNRLLNNVLGLLVSSGFLGG